MINLKKALKQKLKVLLTSSFDYWSEMEYNSFRVNQLAKFGVMVTSGLLFFVFIKDILTVQEWKIYWKLMGAYLFPPAGKETVIPVGLTNNLSPFLLIFSILLVDIMTSIAVLTNWWVVDVLIKHSKIIKRWTERIQNKTEKLVQKKYGKLLPLVLLLFMWIPFQGSGSITTSILGTWLGFSKRTVIVVVLIGSLFSTFFITFLYFNLLEIL